MLFNSFEFIFVFLPVVLILYFFLNRQRLVIASKAWLVLASLVFYSWWNIKYLPLILCSIIFNFSIGTGLSRIEARKNKYISRKAILIFAIVCNLSLLGYYKYTDFFISNINHLTALNLNLLHIILPLGISFFTFTQIAYLVDAYKGEVKEMDYLNYSLFVTFFPHLIAGPILHHSEMMPQFDNLRNKILNYKNISIGIFLFCIGLFKKVMLADNLAVWAGNGFDIATHLNFVEAWIISLAYTFQLYFDFSGYTDMALGAALMFNIKLPQNFNSPYKAVNIQDFWRRWHMTLSRFLRDYIYIPLGGNRKGELITYQNLMLTFIIGGIWHGASWTFIFWGFLHGLAITVHRIWQKFNIKIHSVLAWFITFNFVNITWVFFRAKSWEDAFKVLNGMFGFSGFSIPKISHFNFKFEDNLSQISWNDSIILILVFCFIIILYFRNSNKLAEKFKPSWSWSIAVCIMLTIALFNMHKVSEFLYFNF